LVYVYQAERNLHPVIDQRAIECALANFEPGDATLMPVVVLRMEEGNSGRL